MKKLLLPILIIFILMGSLFLNPAWASYINHSQDGSWNFNGRVDDFNYVYCDLQLPVDQRVGSLTEVTLKVDCIDDSVGRYDEKWRLDIYRAGNWDGVSGSIPQGVKTAEVSGVGAKGRSGYSGTKTLTISIPDQGYNGLGFRYIDLTDDRERADFDITVTRIKYRLYSVDGFNPTITYERHVLLSVIQDTPVNNMGYVITRNPKDTARDQYGAGYKDMNVDPEKYYTYSLYWGFNLNRATGPAITQTLKIPSDASGAKASADAAKNAADSANANVNYIRNTQLPSIENKITNLQTTVNNFVSDAMSPIVKIQTTSGARATSASSIPCIVSVTDNSAGPFEYSVNGGAWAALPASGQVALPVTQPGMNTITVEVKDLAGNIGRDVISIRKL